MNGIERLKSMIEGPFEKPLFKIFLYLKSREDMYDKYLNEEKSMSQMYDYIKNEARKQAKNGVAIIEDSVVYGLAIHYFDESNEDLGLNKKEIPKLEKPKKDTAEKEKVETPKDEEREQVSLFDGTM